MACILHCLLRTCADCGTVRARPGVGDRPDDKPCCAAVTEIPMLPPALLGDQLPVLAVLVLPHHTSLSYSSLSGGHQRPSRPSRPSTSLNPYRRRAAGGSKILELHLSPERARSRHSYNRYVIRACASCWLPFRPFACAPAVPAGQRGIIICAKDPTQIPLPKTSLGRADDVASGQRISRLPAGDIRRGSPLPRLQQLSGRAKGTPSGGGSWFVQHSLSNEQRSRPWPLLLPNLPDFRIPPGPPVAVASTVHSRL